MAIYCKHILQAYTASTGSSQKMGHGRTKKRLKNYKRCSNLTLQTDIYIQPPPTHPHLFDSIVMHPANQSLMVSGGTQYTEDDDIINVDSVADADDEGTK